MTASKIKTMVREIVAQASEYPREVREEAIGELVSVTIREEELTSDEIDALYTELYASGF